MRRRQGLGLPRIRSGAVALAVGLIACSFVFALTKESIGGLLLLTPSLVFGRWMLWQPLSYALIETTPVGVLFGALIIWSIGAALEQSWGMRKMVWFGLGTTVVAGILTSLLGLLVPSVGAHSYGGGTVLSTVLWVSYGLAFSSRQINFWGLPVTGNVFALIGLGFLLLTAAFYGWRLVVPDAFGVLLAFMYLRVASPGDWWLRFSGWRLQRQLRSRSKHLSVISGQRNMPKDSDRYLH